MNAYNLLNGTHCSDHKELLTDILRTEWGFDGTVITDWGALYDRIKAFQAGCDLNMPGGSHFMERAARKAVKRGELSEAEIDRSVRRILELVEQASKVPAPAAFDAAGHDELACEVARQGAVLLKNEDQILPVRSDDMILIGHMARQFRYQGAGSSHINPTQLTNLADALPDVAFADCGKADGSVDDTDLRHAVAAAKKAKVAVVVAGLPDEYESEGFDRSDMRMPEGHIRLIEAVSEANANTVVVLLGGSPMELPWLDRVKAVLYMGLSGQAGGRACADLLLGQANPSGKLTESWPMRYADVPSSEIYGSRDAEYQEGIYLGYRYYDKAGLPVRFPFGHGLSYTSFAYGDLKIDGNTVTAVIENTGSVAGAEVVQLYVAPPVCGIHRPIRELKRFARIELAPGEQKTVRFELDDRCFAIWHKGWTVPGGAYTIELGSSSRDIRLRGTIERQGTQLPQISSGWYDRPAGKPVRGDWEIELGRKVTPRPEPVRGQYTLDNTCLEMIDSSWVIRLVCKIAEDRIRKSFGGDPDKNDPSFRMMLTCAIDCPLRAMVISGNGALTDSVVNGLLHIANGHPLKGILAMLK